MLFIRLDTKRKQHYRLTQDVDMRTLLSSERRSFKSSEFVLLQYICVPYGTRTAYLVTSCENLLSKLTYLSMVDASLSMMAGSFNVKIFLRISLYLIGTVVTQSV
jgi:hypothetical protein